MKTNLELEKGDIAVDRDIQVEGALIVAYLETWFDVHKKFGLQVANDDDTVDLYAIWNVETDELFMRYNVHRDDQANPHISIVVHGYYTPSAAEAALVREEIAEAISRYYHQNPQEFVQETLEGDQDNMKTPPAVPLSLEELREMGGQPVYIADYGEWAIVAIEQESRNSLPKPYLCGVHHDAFYNQSTTFYYDFEMRNLTVYQCPVHYDPGAKTFVFSSDMQAEKAPDGVADYVAQHKEAKDPERSLSSEIGM